MSLNANKITGLKSGDHADGIVPGMFLRVGKRARTFCIRYRSPLDGANRTHRLGHYPHLSLADARELGRLAREAVLDGRDPTEEREAATLERQLNTFRQLAEAVLEAKRPNVRPSTARNYDLLLPAILRKIGDRPAADVTAGEIVDLRDSLSATRWNANQSVKLVRMIYNEAVEAKRVAYNPTYGIKLLKKKASEATAAAALQRRTLSPDELAAVWSASATESASSRAITRIAMLTGLRISEVCWLEWEDIDLERSLWIMPAHKRKGGNALAIPLSAELLEVLEDYRDGVTAGYAFPALRSRRDGKELEQVWRSYPNSLLRGLRDKAELSAHWAWHSLRKTMSTVATRPEEPVHPSDPSGLGISRDVVSAMLGHADESVRGKHYLGDPLEELLGEKRRAFSAWGAYVRAAVGNNW